MRRETVTLRLPPELLAKLRRWKSPRQSLNAFIVEAVDREVRRRRGLHASQAILARRAVLQERQGLQPDSTPLVRALREGEGRRG